MPEKTDPGKVLRGGEFYSPVQARLGTEDVLLSELRQPVSRHVPRHEHELAYITVVLHGDYLEGDHGHLSELSPLSAVFNPSGISHATTIGPAGAAFFTIEFREIALQQLGLKLPSDTTFDRGPGTILWPGLRLYSAFRNHRADALLIEAAVFELLGTVSGHDAPGNSAPCWLARVKDRLADEISEPASIRELAREAGVHPVHLARVFRKFENQTPGEYLHRLQVRAACKLLRDPEWTLAAIAAECGFSDQSHLNRIFRRMTGSTPARFRDAITSRA